MGQDGAAGEEAEVDKLLMLSTVGMGLALPIWLARQENRGRALKKALLGYTVFNFFWLFSTLVVVPRLMD